MLQMQFINATHQSQIKAKSVWLGGQRVIRGFGGFNSFALSNPASALAPVLAGRSWRVAAPDQRASKPRRCRQKTLTAFSSSWVFQPLIRLGCNSNCLHSCAVVLSSRNAARATRALSVGVCGLRVRRADCLNIENSCLSSLAEPNFIPRVSISKVVEICAAISAHRNAGL